MIPSYRTDKANTTVCVLALFLWACVVASQALASPVLQVGAFNDYGKAQAMQAKIRALVQKKVGIVTNQTPIRAFHYVMISGFNGLDEAQQIQATLGQADISAMIFKQDEKDKQIYRWVKHPEMEAIRVQQGYDRLQRAIINPEFMIDNWVGLPISPNVKNAKSFKMTIREAILLALRYNPDIQGEELTRITQRYQLRQAEWDLELQYALTGSAAFNKATAQGIASLGTQSYLLSPELNLKTRYGTKYQLKMDNNYANTNTYNPVINFSIDQPLLRDFGPTVNEQNLLDTIDNEVTNKLNLRQTIISKITTVVTSYRQLISDGNTLDTQRRGLKEAIKTFNENKLKIKAGELERTGNVQAAYQVENLKLQLVSAENTFKTSVQSLLTNIGLDPNMHIEVPSDVTLTDVPVPDVEETIAYALAHNTSYLNQQIQWRIEQRAYRVALNQQLWELDLSSEISTGSSSGIGRDSHLSSLVNGRNVAKSVSLNLTVPINDVGLKSQLIAAKVSLEQLRLQLVTAKRQVITQVRNRITDIEAQANSYLLAKKQVVLAQQSYDIQKQRQAAGIASSVDVTNTQDQLLGAQVSLISAKVSYLNGIADLESYLGVTLKTWNIKLRYGA